MMCYDPHAPSASQQQPATNPNRPIAIASHRRSLSAVIPTSNVPISPLKRKRDSLPSVDEHHHRDSRRPIRAPRDPGAGAKAHGRVASTSLLTRPRSASSPVRGIAHGSQVPRLAPLSRKEARAMKLPYLKPKRAPQKKKPRVAVTKTVQRRGPKDESPPSTTDEEDDNDSQ